jgi:hypothetical protein
MDLFRHQFRPQAECEMRCVQLQVLERATPFIGNVGIEPALLVPLFYNRESANSVARLPAICGQASSIEELPTSRVKPVILD